MDSPERQPSEIDLSATLTALWKRKLTIVVVALLTAAAAFGYSAYLAEPEYQSTSRVYVVNRQNEQSSALTNTDLQAGAYLVHDYREIILSQRVMEETVTRLGLEMTPEAFARKVRVAVPQDTRILSMTVTDADAEQAALMANAWRVVAVNRIQDMAPGSAVETLDEAQVPSSPSSPKVRQNVMLGFLGGGTLAAVVVLLIEVLDDRVRRPEHVEDTLGLPLLGVIPDLGRK